jgi:uncharacterized membrane protein YdjX (TVP38/TMEM64 family)
MTIVPAFVKYKKFITAILIILIIASLWLISYHYLSFKEVKQCTLHLYGFSEKHTFITATAILIIHILSMILSLPTKALFTIVAGALLGTIKGSAITLAGVISGTSVLFFAMRNFTKEKKNRWKIKPLADKVNNQPFLTIMGLRLIPTLPYGPITVAAALTQIKYKHFIAGSIAGDLPIVVLYAIAGNRLAALTNASDALSPSTAAIFAAAGILIIAGAIVPLKKQN